MENIIDPLTLLAEGGITFELLYEGTAEGCPVFTSRAA